MNKNLAYRGIRSTEFILLISLMLAATILAVIGKLTPEWANLTALLYGGYVTSRIGTKGAEAYRDAKIGNNGYTSGVP